MNLDKTENTEINIPTVGERLSNIVLDSLEKHQSFMRLVRMGGIDTEQIEALTDNERILLKVRSLIRVIAIQRELVSNARPIVYHIDYTSWKQKYKSEEQKSKNPFENEDNDYNKLLLLLKFLKYAEQKIIIADQTKTLKDDFLVYKPNYKGEEKAILTNNFFEMVSDLEDSFEDIYKIMLENGILTTTKGDIGSKNKNDI